jgi:hypothetical protein
MYLSRLIALALLLSSSVFGRDLWLRMRSENFDLITNCGTGTSRQVLRWLEDIRQVLPIEAGPNRPKVFVFRSEAGFKSYAATWPESVAGFYRPDGDLDYIAAWNNGGPFDRVILHEYVHLSLNRNGARVPPWLNEGMADLYSASWAGIAVGGPVSAHVATLQSNAWADLPKLFAILRPSEIFQFAGGAKLFYAESWALAAMLKLDPGYRDGMTSFLARLQSGESSEGALRETYRKTVDEIMRDLRLFVSRSHLPRIGVKVNEAKEVNQIPAETLSPLAS